MPSNAPPPDVHLATEFRSGLGELLRRAVFGRQTKGLRWERIQDKMVLVAADGAEIRAEKPWSPLMHRAMGVEIRRATSRASGHAHAPIAPAIDFVLTEQPTVAPAAPQLEAAAADAPIPSNVRVFRGR